MEAICPACLKRFPRVRDELAGKKAKCTCGNTFVLGGLIDRSTKAVAAETGAEPRQDSVDLSSANVFENSYSGLDQILAGEGSTAPVPTPGPAPLKQQPEAVRRTPSTSSSRSAEAQLANARDETTNTKPQPQPQPQPAGHQNAGMSIGFIAAILSGCLAVWCSVFLLASRYFVFEYQPLSPVSQTFHDIARATFGDLLIGVGLERSFVVIGWVISSVAACLLVLGIGQLINAFARLFRRQHLFRGIDGATGLLASLMLFTVLITLFFHSSHMRELSRELTQRAGRKIDEDSAIGRNVLELQSKHAAHSQQFVICVSVTAAVPLCVCMLSLTRVYVTLGEANHEIDRQRQ